MEKENWKDVNGYEGLYKISSLGRVLRLRKEIVDTLGRTIVYEEKILKNNISKSTGYPFVCLTKDGKHKKHNIHTLIADAFIPNLNNLPCINHIDEDRSKSVLSNLERCSYLYNNTYGNIKRKRNDTLRENSIPIIQYSKNGKVIAKYHKTLAEMERLLGYSIKGCINGNKTTAGGFVWKREGDPFDYKGYKYFNRPVNQYDYYGNLVKSYDGGLEEIRETTTFDIDNIRGCLKGKCKTSQGFVWLFDGTIFEYTHTEKKKNEKKERIKYGQQKGVIRIDKNGNTIESFQSVSHAAKVFGFDRHYFTRTKANNGVIEIRGMRFIVETIENEKIPKGHKGERPDLKGLHSKPICKYSLDGHFIKEYPSAASAAIELGNRNKSASITNCCRGNLKTAYGFVWYYSDKQPKVNQNGK